MLYKKLKIVLITILSTLLIGTVVMKGLSIHNDLKNTIKVNKEVVQKIDLTEFKIKQVLNTNKLQTLEVTFSVSVQDEEYDKTKYFDGLSKLLTTRKVNVEQEFKGIFNYDLSRAKFTNNMDGTYTISINPTDVKVNIESLGEAKVTEKDRVLGYYTSKDMSKVFNKMQIMAKDKVNTKENINTTVNNVIINLTNLFKNVGVDTSNINFDTIDN